MSNERFIEDLITLKANGINYSILADEAEMPRSTFYYYLKKNRFPYSARKRIEDVIYRDYKEILEDE